MSHYRKLIPKPVKKSIKNLLSKINSRPDPPRSGRPDHRHLRGASAFFLRRRRKPERCAAQPNCSQRGYEVDLIAIPFKWYPPEQIVNSIHLWRQLDLSEADGKKIDLLITTKFPSYMANHPNKVLWLVHQFRQAYDLYETPISGFDPKSRSDNKLRAMIIRGGPTRRFKATNASSRFRTMSASGC